MLNRIINWYYRLRFRITGKYRVVNLSADFKFEEYQTLRAEHGMDAEEMLTELMIEAIENEVENGCVQDL